MTPKEVFAEGLNQLRNAGVPDASNDCRRLFQHIFGTEPEIGTVSANPEIFDKFSKAIKSRCLRQPVSQIIGRRAFWKHNFVVTTDTLDPRPETELLVELGIKAAPKTVLDLGTGTGAIILSILADCKSATGVATDKFLPALTVAERNAAELGLSNRVEFKISDWFDAVNGRFDLIVSNPPYIPESDIARLEPDVRDWEPIQALTPGGDGLSCYRQIARDLEKYLAPGGAAFLEFGKGQADDVTAIFKQAGFNNCTVHIDLSGTARVIEVQRSTKKMLSINEL